MLRRRPSAPANDAVAVVPVFTTDPHGAALFSGSLSGGIGSARPVIDSRATEAFNGWMQSPQYFRGMSSVAGLGGGRPSVSRHTTLDQEVGMAKDSVQEIFTQRAAARRLG